MQSYSLLECLEIREFSKFRSFREPVRLRLTRLDVASLLFVFASAVLVLGVGTSYNDLACKLGIWVSRLCKTHYRSNLRLIVTSRLFNSGGEYLSLLVLMNRTRGIADLGLKSSIFQYPTLR